MLLLPADFIHARACKPNLMTHAEDFVCQASAPIREMRDTGKTMLF